MSQTNFVTGLTVGSYDMLLWQNSKTNTAQQKTKIIIQHIQILFR